MLPAGKTNAAIRHQQSLRMNTPARAVSTAPVPFHKYPLTGTASPAAMISAILHRNCCSQVGRLMCRCASAVSLAAHIGNQIKPPFAENSGNCDIYLSIIGYRQRQIIRHNGPVAGSPSPHPSAIGRYRVGLVWPLRLAKKIQRQRNWYRRQTMPEQPRLVHARNAGNRASSAINRLRCQRRRRRRIYCLKQTAWRKMTHCRLTTPALATGERHCHHRQAA